MRLVYRDGAIYTDAGDPLEGIMTMQVWEPGRQGILPKDSIGPVQVDIVLILDRESSEPEPGVVDKVVTSLIAMQQELE